MGIEQVSDHFPQLGHSLASSLTPCPQPHFPFWATLIWGVNPKALERLGPWTAAASCGITDVCPESPHRDPAEDRQGGPRRV